MKSNSSTQIRSALNHALPQEIKKNRHGNAYNGLFYNHVGRFYCLYDTADIYGNR